MKELRASLMYRLNRYVFARIEGRRRWQPLFRWLHHVALRGMNYGGGASIEESGELYLIDSLAAHFAPLPAVTILDVGANRGDYSAALLDRWPSPTNLHVYAFEPSPIVFPLLRERFSRFGSVSVFQFGFSDTVQSRLLFVPENPELSGLGSVFQRRLDHLGIDVAAVGQIELRTLDDFCTESGIDRIHLLKLDVEGGECAVLKGAKRLLSEGRVDFIQLEFGGCNIDARVFWQDLFYLLSGQFELYRILRDGFEPVARYDEREEIFVTTNFLAGRRDLQSRFP